jgi:DNA primase
MDAKEINLTFDLVKYVGQLVQLTKKSNYYIGPCPMCGGRDRFNIKRAECDLWICRQCGDGKYHSPIDFIMQYHNIGFKDALTRMGGDLQAPAPVRTRVVAPVPVQVAPDQEWQSQALKEVDAASDCLIEEPDGTQGRRYLLWRGISRASVHLWLLGFGRVHNRPAIFIPYMDVGHVITAVKYRFIDRRAKQNKALRFSMKSGSLPYLFGLQHVQASDHTLLFVEGEFNAISVAQCVPRGVAVVSAGSESNGNAVLLEALASRFDRAVIWMDNPIKALAMRERMRRDAQLLQSPIKEGRKWDANEMLKAGLLPEFLTHQLGVACLGKPTDPILA